MADEAANQLAAQVYDKKISDANESMMKLVNELYEKYVPSPVRQCAVEYAKYYQMYRRYVSFVTEECNGGRNYKSLEIGFLVPELASIVISADDWKRLDKADDELILVRQERNKYIRDVSEALFNLRTPKRVEEMFPEALPFMNFADTTALQVDLQKLRSVLKY